MKIIDNCNLNKKIEFGDIISFECNNKTAHRYIVERGGEVLSISLEKSSIFIEFCDLEELNEEYKSGDYKSLKIFKNEEIKIILGE